MPRNDGQTPERPRLKHRRHRMNRRGRAVRQVTRIGQGRKAAGWGRSAI